MEYYKPYDYEKHKELAKYCNENNLIIDEDDEKYFSTKLISSQEEILRDLRYQRELECFSVINRGKLWYNTLTDEQLIQLQVWYTKWLNVTEDYNKQPNGSYKVPDKPSWLK